ncbi:MAG: DNA cytosine methyltransferase [Desulfovibrio sp.]|jgi:DNA (cytosine-5)-methyltransferase 1|nr:DNA cytosine methyltransferase [Desulfovibrio sp.]
MQSIKIVDLFAGPGGLGEGFSSFQADSRNPFNITVSVEKDKFAHSTLRLRAYWRLLKRHRKPMNALHTYYKGRARRPWTEDTEDLWEEAKAEALLLELGKDEDNAQIYKRICQQISNDEHWVLIGGPPCQAYSVVGRVRVGEKNKKDPRHRLYKEYLNVIREFRPSIFVMENVRGMLSCQLEYGHIIHRIMEDLACPGQGERGVKDYKYSIHSLVADTCYETGMDAAKLDLKKFIVQCEQYGIPQARHRVILVGIREDVTAILPKLIPSAPVTVWDAISDMPPLRSGISRQKDSAAIWKDLVSAEYADLARCAKTAKRHRLTEILTEAGKKVISEALSRGGQWIEDKYSRLPPHAKVLHSWLRDESLGGWLNHETRAHMASDLRRYAYIATHASIKKKNPVGSKDFDLPGLAPNHANWETGHFDDRFKVQLANRPATTITSHLSKDGHSFIHPDPAQCRSLTVREAARLQTFPDNYFFEGPRTAQYVQVGNAVPPLLAMQIADCVWSVLQDAIFFEQKNIEDEVSMMFGT